MAHPGQQGLTSIPVDTPSILHCTFDDGTALGIAATTSQRLSTVPYKTLLETLDGARQQQHGWIQETHQVVALVNTSSLQSSGWSIQVPSDVTGELGKTVILPCTFTHPYKIFDRTLTAIWRIREPYNGTVVFKCVAQGSSELCKTAVSYKNKYKLLGNPRHKDLTIRIDNLTWSDTAPRIINITVSSNGDRTFKARCTAEGEPAPSLTWTGPHSSNFTSVTNTNHQVTKELQYLTHDGKYTCTAVNSHGRAEGAVYFYKFKTSNSSLFLILIFVPLGIKVLVLLVIVSFTVFWRGGVYTQEDAQVFSVDKN
nr:PREDICTED: sialic acid-binding Ig-like lectin 15 [Struthio camelus australis]